MRTKKSERERHRIARSKKRGYAIIPSNPQHVIINGEVSLYREKAPFEASGLSLKSALEYDVDSDRLKCHECGGWHKSLAAHLREHGLTARQYKIAHGLNQSSALVCEGMRSNLIRIGRNRFAKFGSPLTEDIRRLARERVRNGAKSKKSEHLNSRGRCNAQVLALISELARKLGRRPLRTELAEVGIGKSLIEWRFGSIKKACELAAVDGLGGGRYSPELVTAMVKSFFFTHGRLPSPSDCRRRLMPHRSVIDRLYGGWRTAKKRWAREVA